MEIVTAYADHPAFHAARSAAEHSACVKRRVGAAVWSDELGLLGAGNNDVAKPQARCPREVYYAGYGELYRLCQLMCEQQHHAEIAALAHARRCVPLNLLEGASVYVWGHDHACPACLEMMREVGISRVVFPVNKFGSNPSNPGRW